jgi:hypothetical protein
MSTETVPSAENEQISARETSKPSRQAKMAIQEILDSLKSAQDDIGQISELSSEEQTLVAEFFISLSQVMEPVAQSIRISTEKLSKYFSDLVQANVDKNGYLVILDAERKVQLKDLREEKHRDLMISVLEDLLPRFKQLFSDQRQKIEDRMKFITVAAKEVQKMSKALSEKDE